MIEIDEKSKSFDIDEIDNNGSLKVDGRTYLINVISTGHFIELEIKPDEEDKKEDEEEKGLDKFRKILKISSASPDGINANIDIKGLGISIIDEEPKELIYLSIYKINANIIRENK